MNKLKAFFTNTLVINLIVICIVGVLGLIGVNMYLKSFTLNGQSITVPDFTGMNMEEVIATCKNKELAYQIEDTLFLSNMPKSTIVDQQPTPNSKVKKERTIYLTLNADVAPMVEVINLTDKPLRQAKVILKNEGFVVNEDYEYVANPALNWVQGIKLNGKEIAWGDKIPKGSKLTLVLGNGLEKGESNLPDLRGRTLDEVRVLLRLRGLTFGEAYFEDDSDNDSTTAVVYKQKPAHAENKQINPNEPIYMHFTSPEVYESFYKNDSTSVE